MNKTFLHISENNIDFNRYEINSDGISKINIYDEISNILNLENNTVFFYFLRNVVLLNNENIFVEVSENNLEILLSFEFKINDLYKSIKNDIIFYPFYLSDSKINNVLKFDDTSLLFILDDPIEADDNLDIYKVKNHTDVHNITYERRNPIEVDLIIRNHRKDNLQNYKNRISRISRKKTYGDVKDDRIETINGQNSLYGSNLNIDYGDFNTFIKYGSALSKIVNFSDKIDKIKEINNDNLNPSKSDQEKLNVLETFMPFENWAYTEKYLKLSENEFNIWLSQKKEEAVDFDGKNNELLLYQLPRYIVNNDEYGYLTNFVFLMGDFFDNLYMYAESLSYINEYSINEKNKVPTFAIEDIIEQMGFSFDMNFSNEEFKKYFQNEDNVNKLSDILSHRIIDSMPQLSKMKGSIKAIEYLLNIFGIPKGVYNLVEFSKKKRSNEFNEFINEDDEWFLNIDENEYVDIDITDADMDINLFTFEFVVKNLGNGGQLLFIDAQNYIDYTFDGENLDLTVVLNNQQIFSNTYKITDYIEAWSFISIRRDSKKISVRVAQKIQNVDEILNDKTFTQSVDLSLPVTFNNIRLGGGLHITEFRLFNSFLNKLDSEIHINDIRSVNESFEKTLNTRINFYNPVSALDDFKVIDGNEYNITFSTNIDISDFTKYTFRNVLLSNTIFSDDMYSDKIRIIETDFVNNLDNIYNPYIFFDNDENVDEDRTLTSKVRKNIFEDEYEDQATIGIYLSENDIINKDILRKKSLMNTINPEWFDENRYSFNNFNSLDGVRYKDLTLSIKQIYGLFNDKIFDIIKEFIPARTILRDGIMIKNNILNKNKDVYESKIAKSLEYKMSPIDLKAFIFDNEEYLENNTDIDISKSDISFQNSITQTKKSLNIVLKTDRSRYLNSIETYESNWKSPFLRRVIRGRTEGSEILTAEQLREFLNYGAQILVL